MARELVWFEGFNATKGYDGHFVAYMTGPYGHYIEPTDWPWRGIVENGGRYFGNSYNGGWQIEVGDWFPFPTPTWQTKKYLWAQFGHWFKYRETTGIFYGFDYTVSPYHWLTDYTETVQTSTKGFHVLENPLSSGVTGLEVYYAYGSTYPTEYTASGVKFRDDLLLMDGNWHYVECRVFAATGLTGIAELRVDGVQIARMTNIRTCATLGSGGWNGFLWRPNWGSQDNFGDVEHDDMYFELADSEGELAWRGKNAIESMNANTDGDDSGFTPSAGSSHNAMIRLPMSEDTYLSAAVGTQRELFVPVPIDTRVTRTVYGVKVGFRARKTGTGIRKIRPVVKVNGTVYVGDTFYLGMGWREYAYIWELNPDTSAVWTDAQVNAAQFGFEQVTP